MVTRATTTHPDIPAGKTLLQPFLLAQSRDQTLRQTRSLCSKGTFFVLSLTSEDAPNQTQAHLVLLNSPHRPFRLNSTFSSTRLPAQPHLEGHFNLPLAEVPPRWPRGPPYPLHRPTLQSWQCLHLQPRQMLLERKKLHFCTHSPAYLAKNQGFEKIAYFLKKPQAPGTLVHVQHPHTHILVPAGHGAHQPLWKLHIFPKPFTQYAHDYGITVLIFLCSPQMSTSLSIYKNDEPHFKPKLLMYSPKHSACRILMLTTKCKFILKLKLE